MWVTRAVNVSAEDYAGLDPGEEASGYVEGVSRVQEADQPGEVAAALAPVQVHRRGRPGCTVRAGGG